MLNAAQESLKMDEQALRRELEGMNVQFRGRACKCPFHDDRSASAGIFLTDRGFWHFKCLACAVDGDIFDIRARLNKTIAADELKKLSDDRRIPLPPTDRTRVYGTLEALVGAVRNVEAVYKYTNPDTGEIELAVIRSIDRESGKKKIIQCTPTAGGWWMKGRAGTNPIYNRARVRESDIVIVVEGEKCVHCLHKVGFVATTSPQGAGKAALADWSMLAGKTVYLWPDNDPVNPPNHPKAGERTGISHMQDVREILQKLSPAPTIFMIDCDSLELPEKGDVVDFVAPYNTVEEKREAIQAVLGDAVPVGVAADYANEMQAVVEGRRRTLPFAIWEILTRASRALMPGTVTCICGDPGSGKSLFLMEACVVWNELQVKACIYELEDDRNYHLRRAHAQREKCAGITDNEWVESNAGLYLSMQNKRMAWLGEMGSIIWDRPLNGTGNQDDITLEMLVAWVEQRAINGYEIICIDPVTAAATSEKPWIADLKFMNRVKAIASKYGSRVILVTHPRKSSGKGGAGLHDLAGGAAYPRFSHTVLWIERNDSQEEMSIRRKRTYPVEAYTPSRILKITKARNGPGAGKRIAFDFDAEGLNFKEVGLVESEKGK